MPAVVRKEGKKFRVVDDDTGQVLKNAAGTSADGGGHTSEAAADRQARAINRSLSRAGKI